MGRWKNTVAATKRYILRTHDNDLHTHFFSLFLFRVVLLFEIYKTFNTNKKKTRRMKKGDCLILSFTHIYNTYIYQMLCGAKKQKIDGIFEIWK